ncbi:MAG: SGNH/GDSL hydrolase family protein [Saprospiraceae bacterium]
MNLKYLFGAGLSIPLLPLMYVQAKNIRASIPKLPEATGLTGVAKQSSKKVLRMLTIGESTIAGVGVNTHEEGFTGTLAKTLAAGLGSNIQWKVYAKSGYTAKRVTYKILPTITEQAVDLVVIGLGANDAFKLNRPGKWRDQMQTLIETLRSRFPDTPICFINMPPIKEFPAFTKLIKMTIGNLVEILGQELDKLVKRQKHVYFRSDIITMKGWSKKFKLNKTRKDFFSDGVHPSKLTYQIWGKNFGEFLLSNEEIVKLLKRKTNMG